jgi:hypothetical protein
MGLKVTIGSAETDGITDAEIATRPGVKVRLIIRKTLDGNIIIEDHPDIDIIIMPGANKIVAMAKDLNSGVVYGAQNRLFKYLQSRGVVTPESIQGGSVFASMEAVIAKAPELPVVKISILNIANWMDKEKPGWEFVDHYEDEVDQDYVDPDKEYSTELGQVPQAADKGSIRPSLSRGPYGMSIYNYYGY